MESGLRTATVVAETDVTCLSLTRRYERTVDVAAMLDQEKQKHGTPLGLVADAGAGADTGAGAASEVHKAKHIVVSIFAGVI